MNLLPELLSSQYSLVYNILSFTIASMGASFVFFLVVRQQVEIRPKATGKQLKLFKDDGIIKNYRYSCFITNLGLSAQNVWTLYRGRADCENRIKELKQDFGFEDEFFYTMPAMSEKIVSEQ